MEQAKITIDGSVWTIRWSRWLKKSFGYCDPKRRQVVLAKGMNKKVERGTLLHELIHAALPFLSEEYVLLLENTLNQGCDILEERNQEDEDL